MRNYYYDDDDDDHGGIVKEKVVPPVASIFIHGEMKMTVVRSRRRKTVRLGYDPDLEYNLTYVLTFSRSTCLASMVRIL